MGRLDAPPGTSVLFYSLWLDYVKMGQALFWGNNVTVA
jgi:hypothetical protein